MPEHLIPIANTLQTWFGVATRVTAAVKMVPTRRAHGGIRGQIRCSLITIMEKLKVLVSFFHTCRRIILIVGQFLNVALDFMHRHVHLKSKHLIRLL